MDPERPKNSVEHKPSGSWVFDAGVSACFPDMLARSIPALAELRLVTLTMLKHAPPSGAVLDLGASLGGSTVGLARTVVGVDNSPEMVAEAAAQGVQVHLLDIVDQELPPGEYAAVVSCFTLQFIPPCQRMRVLGKIHAVLPVGGVLIIAEKVSGVTPWVDDILIKAYHERKAQNGYSSASIKAKAYSLRHKLSPVRAKDLESQLHDTGFGDIECVWRSLSFGGWFARKR